MDLSPKQQEFIGTIVDNMSPRGSDFDYGAISVVRAAIFNDPTVTKNAAEAFVAGSMKASSLRGQLSPEFFRGALAATRVVNVVAKLSHEIGI